MLVALPLLVALLGFAEKAGADVSIYTPAMGTQYGNYHHLLCRVANVGPDDYFVDVYVRDAFDGDVIDSAAEVPVTDGSTVEPVATGSDAYCEVVAASATQADNLRVSIVARDHLGGLTYGALPGVRALGGSGSVIATPSLWSDGSSSERLECFVINVGSTSQQVTMEIFEDDGSTNTSSTPTIAAGDGTYLTASAGTTTGRCTVTAASGTAASNLRVSFYVSEGLGMSYSPVAGTR
jgi:hypothetical protein